MSRLELKTSGAPRHQISTSALLLGCLVLGTVELSGCTGSSGGSSWAFWNSSREQQTETDPFGLEGETRVASAESQADPRMAAVDQFLDREVGPQAVRAKQARIVLDEQPAGRLNISDSPSAPVIQPEPKAEELPHIASNDAPAWARIRSDDQVSANNGASQTSAPWYQDDRAIELASAQKHDAMAQQDGVQAPSPVAPEMVPAQAEPVVADPATVVISDAPRTPATETQSSWPAKQMAQQPNREEVVETLQVAIEESNRPQPEAVRKDPNSIATMADALLAEISRREAEAKLKQQLMNQPPVVAIQKPQPSPVVAQTVSQTSDQQEAAPQGADWPQIVPRQRTRTTAVQQPAAAKLTESIVFDDVPVQNTWQGNRLQTETQQPFQELPRKNEVIQKDPTQEFFQTVVKANQPGSIEVSETQNRIQQIAGSAGQEIVTTANAVEETVDGVVNAQPVVQTPWYEMAPPQTEPAISQTQMASVTHLPELNPNDVPALPPINVPYSNAPAPVAGDSSMAISLGGPVLVTEDATPVAPTPPGEPMLDAPEQMTLEEQFARAERSWDENQQSSSWPGQKVIWMAIAAILASLILRALLKR